MQDLKLTLVQPDMHWQDPAANYELLDGMLADTGHEADLIILPEMFTTGFTMDAAENYEEPSGPSTQWLEEMAAKYQAHVCGSLIIRDDNRYFNRLLWVSPEGKIQSYDKRHLFRMADEQEHYAAGNKKLVTTIGDWRICPLVCYDLRFPVWSRNRNDYDLLVYVANWPAPRHSAWRTLLPARAVENLCYAAGVNRIGTDGNNNNYAGQSMVADYLGNIVTDASDQPGTFHSTISLEKLQRYRNKFPAWKDADRFELIDTPD